MQYEISYAGTVNVKKGISEKNLYQHQVEAMKKLSKIDERKEFKTMVVLPTGGGKTLMASSWLLKNAIDKEKKILWIAHRHLLLEQSFKAFQDNAYSNLVPNREKFNIRVVSGSEDHDRVINIKATDDLLIVSKDSLWKNLKSLNNWLKGEKEVYLIIDEAHHAVAKSYKQIINYVDEKVKNFKLIGLTATPFRTNENEKGALKKIFTDDIVYKINLKELITRGILSAPKFKSIETKENFGKTLNINKIKELERSDNLPKDIIEFMIKNGKRNRRIVEEYSNNKKEYGKTIVFAINRIHADSLKKLFKERGIKAGVVISGVVSGGNGCNSSNRDNSINIEKYKNGELDVLINVNILTEGIDLPKTKTVFLTRQTISSGLMTQMVGRALRGEYAGGTKEANIVSFIDKWEEKIAWVNPEILLDELYEENKSNTEYKKHEITLISRAKIEEFAKIIDCSIETSKLEKLDFIKRIPLGIYSISFIENQNSDEENERNHQILVYDSTKEHYEKIIEDLPKLFKKREIENEILDEKTVEELLNDCKKYFSDDMLPTYDERDVEYLLKYYAQKECKPNFIKFDELSRKKLDISIIAKEIVDKDMRRSEKIKLIDRIWEEESNLIKVYFNQKIFFIRQLEIEENKLDVYNREFNLKDKNKNNLEGEKRSIEDMTLEEIKKVNIKKYDEIKTKVFETAIDKNGLYYCKGCNKKHKSKRWLQIDHIKPISKGGKTNLKNLQILCIKCNRKKSDKYE